MENQMSTNDYTPRSKFLFPESIQESVSHTAVQEVSESKGQVPCPRLTGKYKN